MGKRNKIESRKAKDRQKWWFFVWLTLSTNHAKLFLENAQQRYVA
jgi:hypothetical protein